MKTPARIWRPSEGASGQTIDPGEGFQDPGDPGDLVIAGIEGHQSFDSVPLGL
ncbi:hypothetical protein JQT66_19030 [Sulfitobacter mediterraneus]|uniref:hypothetical protein n=1 Tax=Sulfitobacter mediterraneus TaxID=83219 RepID=UPI001931946F|nr:hypothetical protein [Sulfitobacter mediterraneus]MBM1312274.1 hypothetical protein [Sulfitobacter mediterraneus]MBM1316152.1 hypothetical protein [Sulfitobacter mediterraneus]MBM1324517.1 hypothetical protein [Sulfitobacter mediterraneus]MBM1328428.1 hypothetical protein [Sulfitobacter mediterraneus]MBM1399778.1 hypothetical protein [Sulfitobacter mediterraneus]